MILTCQGDARLLPTGEKSIQHERSSSVTRRRTGFNAEAQSTQRFVNSISSLCFLSGEPSEAFGFFVVTNVAACSLLFFLVLIDPLVDLVAKLFGDFLGDPVVGDFFKAHFAVGELAGQLE
jgi:hypothetical protein